MKTEELIDEIQKLPVRKRFFLIERLIFLMRKQEETTLMSQAADQLFEDYASDKNLTVFTDLDFENFYETR
jgi:hypothetical protein